MKLSKVIPVMTTVLLHHLNLVMTTQVGSRHDSLHPETSTPDVIVCEQFYESTCGCDKDHGKPCSKQFTIEHFIVSSSV